MKTDSPEYMEAFVQECFDQNIPVEKAAMLYDTAVRAELLSQDGPYREGFEEVMKSAAQNDVIDEASAVMSPTQRGALPGAVIGGAAALGLPLMFAPRNAARTAFTGLRKLAPAIRKFFPRIAKSKGALPSVARLPWMARLTGGAIGGGALGGALGQYQANRGLKTSPDLPYIPLEFQDALRSGGTKSDVALGVKGLGSSAGSVMDENLRPYKTQLSAIDKELGPLRAQVEKIRTSGSAADQVMAAKLFKRISALEDQRESAMSAASRIMGGLNKSMGRSRSELARYQAELERASNSLNPDAAAAFLRSQHEDKTWGGVGKRIWGSVFGGTANAERQLAQAEQLRSRKDMVEKLIALQNQY